MCTILAQMGCLSLFFLLSSFLRSSIYLVAFRTLKIRLFPAFKGISHSVKHYNISCELGLEKMKSFDYVVVLSYVSIVRNTYKTTMILVVNS